MHVLRACYTDDAQPYNRRLRPRMRNTAVVSILMALFLSACAAADGEKPHSFMTGKDFTIRNNSNQVYYVTGLADAFT